MLLQSSSRGINLEIVNKTLQLSTISMSTPIRRGFEFALELLEGFIRDWGPYLFELLLFWLEKAVFGALYLFGIMDDDVFLDAPNPNDMNGTHSNPTSPNEKLEMRTMMGNMVRSVSLPDVACDPKAMDKSKNVQPSIMNPVKEFIVNFVNRKAVKKREIDEKTNSRHKIGRGHCYIPFQLRNPTWCDLCGEFIWGLYKQCVRCKNCKYTCHWRCREEVDLDCIGAWPQIERNMSIDEVSMKTLHLLEQGEQKRNEPYLMISTNISGGSLRRKIEEFNGQTTGLIMTMKDETVFQGFVRVHMNLLRPINIIAGEQPLSIFEVVGGSMNNKRSRTSFFLPLGTVKALHVTSDTTVQEVIGALLKKFKIADNPRKFALFECYQEQDNHVILRRMSDVEKPLLLRLLWGGADIRHSFSLQENETGDIVWEVFSIPELINFLKILDKEEEEHIATVREKYRKYKEKLQKEIEELRMSVPSDKKSLTKCTSDEADSTE